MRILLLLLALIVFQSCKQPTSENYTKVEFKDLLNRIKNGDVNLLKLSYLDSLGNPLSKEMQSKLNEGLLFRDFYEDQKKQITQVRLKRYSDELVFEEIQIRCMLTNPLNGFEYVNIDCSKSDSLLVDALAKDQGIRNGEEGNITQIDALNLNTVISIVEQCGWPLEEDFITSIWFVIQHSEAEYMAYYYSKFKELENKGLLKSSLMAKMDDRLLMNSGYPQIYGTQIVGQNVYQLRDPDKVNEWRAKVGLSTIEENTRRFGFEYRKVKKNN